MPCCSGGQRKRVNVGLELVSDPWLLFLGRRRAGRRGLGLRAAPPLRPKHSPLPRQPTLCTLLVDEPTSGLDSTASKALVTALHSVSRSGVTAAAVVHQPSWPCCRLFDDLLLLGRGGRTGAARLATLWHCACWPPCPAAHAQAPRCAHHSARLSPCLPPTQTAVYYGRVEGAQAYFEGLGFAFPLHQNPADVLMDILSSALPRAGKEEGQVRGGHQVAG